MLERLERRNKQVWKGHSHILEDVTHVIGGAGIGMLMRRPMRRQSTAVALGLIALSTALHVYADRVK